MGIFTVAAIALLLFGMEALLEGIKWAVRKTQGRIETYHIRRELRGDYW